MRDEPEFYTPRILGMDHEPDPSDPRSPAPRRIPRPVPGHLDVPGIVESFAENMMYAVAKDEFTAAELDIYHALAHAVRTGQALYAGVSNYGPEPTLRAATLLREMGTPCLIHQPRYSMFDRAPEDGLFDVLVREGIGSIAFSPLSKGMLTNRYFAGIPADARAARDPRFLRPEHITDAVLAQTHALDALARARGQSLAQMALAWVLRQPAVTSALIGASKISQIEDNLGAVKNLDFNRDELTAIDRILGGP